MTVGRARVGLLVVGHVDPRSVHIAGDYPELFGALLAPHGIDIVPYAVAEGQLPDSLRECDAWLCSPSRSSVYDELPWIAPVERLHLDIIDQAVPYVGICFGHQLLARVLGAPVERAPGGWGVGVQDYAVVGHEPWMDPTRAGFALLASHQDQVLALPSGARLLAAADYCPVAGFAVGDAAWTIQPHPEFVPALADHLLGLRVELIGAERVATARASLDRAIDAALIASWIARFVEERAGS